MTAAARITSRVNWTVLGLLLERPSYGYELHQRLARRFPPEVLDPTRTHVYAALNVLERNGLIEPFDPRENEETSRPVGGARLRRQPRLHYRATAGGAQAFRSWFAEQMLADHEHAEFLQRLALAAGLDRAGLLDDLVDAYEKACVSEGQTLPLAAGDGLPAQSPDALVRRLTVQARRTALEGHLAFLQYARKEIEAYQRGRKSSG